MVLTFSVPDEIARRLSERVPAAERDRFLLRAVERALPSLTEDELAAIAAEVEADEQLGAEMRAFDACLADGVDDHL